MREFFDAGVASARGQILARSRAVARWAKAVWLICLLASLLPSAYAQTTTRVFGNGNNQFTMDFVTIGNPNNVADTTGTPNPVGSVAYTYNLGKYEVSREQIDKANTAGGLGITMFDMSSFGGNGVNKPATGVTWHEAAKFVNWLNTSTGGTEAYKFVSGTLQPWAPTDAGYNANNLFRNSQAKYVIASRDEWYKGAYGSPSGTWYNYPTGSDSRPSAVAGGTDPNTAVYDGQDGPADINNAGGLSAYGTMGQGGNVWEWNEIAYDGVYNTAGESLEMRSGSWDIGSDYLDASYRNSNIDPAIDGNNSYGFRVAVVSSTTSPTDFIFTINNGEVTITGYTGTGGDVVIPATIGGVAVTQIGNEAFRFVTSITNLTLPSSVTTIGEMAFEGCTLTSITIPDSVTSIGSNAFGNCANLASVTIGNSVTSIGDYAFGNCPNLASVTFALTSSVTSIGQEAFYYCTSLTSVTIPDSVTSIGDFAFSYCTNLTSVTIPNSVESIGESAFDGCTSLASVTIPNSVTSIGSYAFYDCTSLASISIGNRVTSIGIYAFAYCSSLTSITIPNSVISIGSYAFYDCTSLVTVYLPARFANTYTGFGLTASQVYFGFMLTASCNPSEGTILANPNKILYEAGESVVVTATPNAGYLFSNWSGDSTATTSPITLTMDASKAVTANFIQAGGDNDGDGLTNYQEIITFGTNPNVAETASPVAGLYLASQYTDNYAAGQQNVISYPNSNGLYTANQMQAMAIGELVLTKDANGAFTLNYDIEQSEDLQTWTTYQGYALPLTNLPTNKAFVRIKAKQ